MRQAETTRDARGFGGGIGAPIRARQIAGRATTPKEMRMNGKTGMPVVLLVTLFLLAAPGPMEGQLAPPAGPNDAVSARFTLGDIWSRLATGAAGVKRGATFVEPVTGPTTATTKTTDEIMAAAPAADNVNGATAADVAVGKTFWGLRTSAGVWGLQTGSGTIVTYPGVREKTGQTECYKYDSATSSWVLDVGCQANTPANQDGKLQKGIAWPNPRFTKNGNGTVRDNLTGLIWLENAGCFPSQHWGTAMNTANTLAAGYCGLTDGSTAGQWRLPNVKELQSLIDFGHENPAIPNTAGTGQWAPGDPFTNVMNNYYWSSSSAVNHPANAWLVILSNGTSQVVPRDSISYAVSVWPVREGP